VQVGVRTVVFNASEETVVELVAGRRGDHKIDFHFQRYPVEESGNFRQNLKAEFMYFWLRKLIGKSTVKH
jgi:hypothetical protein